jgi:hypothetical protein
LFIYYFRNIITKKNQFEKEKNIFLNFKHQEEKILEQKQLTFLEEKRKLNQNEQDFRKQKSLKICDKQIIFCEIQQNLEKRIDQLIQKNEKQKIFPQIISKDFESKELELNKELNKKEIKLKNTLKNKEIELEKKLEKQENEWKNKFKIQENDLVKKWELKKNELMEELKKTKNESPRQMKKWENRKVKLLKKCILM